MNSVRDSIAEARQERMGGAPDPESFWGYSGTHETGMGRQRIELRMGERWFVKLERVASLLEASVTDATTRTIQLTMTGGAQRFLRESIEFVERLPAKD